MKNLPNLTTWLIAVILLSLTFSCTNTDTGNNAPKKTVEDRVEEKANDANKSDEISTKDGEASNAGFDFPHFMKLDLSDWKKISEKEYGEGDSWGKEYRYQKEGQTLEFTDGLTSYGYNQIFKLYDKNNQLLKERDFYYAMNSMGETVIDYTSQPAQKYSRENETQVDYKLWKSSDKPLLATGEWTISEVEEKAVKK